MTNLYNSNYYQHQKSGSYASAEQIVPIALNYYRPNSIIDLGCGVGNWLSVFKQNGVEKILGIDGDYVDMSQLRIDISEFLPKDLSGPIEVVGRYDMAMSLEVAEHLPRESAESFVQTLTSLSDVVLFSAAVPYQGGTGHVNEQWPEYWVELFKKFDFVVVDPIRKEVWNNDQVDWWYAQNIMYFVKSTKLADLPKLSEARKITFPNQLSLLHPRSISLYTIKFAGWPLFKKKIKSLLKLN